MDSPRICVAKRTRSQINKTIGEFILKKKKEKENDEKSAHSDKSLRNQESRKRRARDPPVDGDFVANKRQKESIKRRGRNDFYEETSDSDVEILAEVSAPEECQNGYPSKQEKMNHGGSVIHETTNFRSMCNANVGHEDQANGGSIGNLSALRSDNSRLKVAESEETRDALSISKRARHNGSKILEETNVKVLRNGNLLRCENGKNGRSWTDQSSKSKSESSSGDDENGQNSRSKYRHSPDSIRSGLGGCPVPKRNSRALSGEDHQRGDNRVDMKFMSDDFQESNSEFSSGEDVEPEDFLFRQQYVSGRASKGHDGVKIGLEDSKTTLPTSHKNQDDLKSMVNVSSNSESETSSEDDSYDTDFEADETTSSGAEWSYSTEYDDDQEGKGHADDKANSVERIVVEKKGATPSGKRRGRPRLIDLGVKSEDFIGLKTKRLGLDYWVDSSERDDKGYATVVAKGWSERLRSRLVSNSKKKKLALGVISNPICISENEASGSSSEKDCSSSDDKDSSDHDSASDNVTRDREQRPHSTSKHNRKKQELGKIGYSKKDEPRKSNRQHGVTGWVDSDSSSDEDCIRNYLMKRTKKSIRQAGKPVKCKSQASDDVWTILEFMWKEGDALETNLSPRKENASAESLPPLKFRFEFEVPQPQVKDEWQKEIDSLFEELEMVLSECEIGSTIVHKEGVEDNHDDIATPEKCCHCNLKLWEPIGIICKDCNIVVQEMKDIFPKMVTRTKEKREWFDSRKMDSSILDRFELDDLASENHCRSTKLSGSVLNLIPTKIKRAMYLHQRDGFKFLWKNIAGETLIENLTTLRPDGGTGCIISHAPGTGKTCLTISFLLTFMTVYPMCRPVIVAPRNMLLTWAEEFGKWGIDIPFHNLNDLELSGLEDPVHASILQKVGTGKNARDYIRMVKLLSWRKGSSILGIGYPLLEKLAGHKDASFREKFRKGLLEETGILVLDEGHTPRNDQSLMWKNLTKVETRRRIILSGTPFQNNFDELYNTLSLVNPGFDQQLFSRSGIDDKIMCWRKCKIGRSTWASLTNSIDKNSSIAIEKLKSMISPFVHVHKGTILQENLFGLKDTLIILKPTDVQKDLLEVVENVPQNRMNMFERLCVLSLITVHPSLAVSRSEFSNCKDRLEKLESSLHAGVKTTFLIEIIRLSIAHRERVLVFSEYLEPLKFLLKHVTSYFCWREGKEVLVMDGKVEMRQRQSSINSFNDLESDAKVLLASIKACGEGINLVGASRVVLLDVVWNPSVERQAISRAYRLGQKKPVYVYHLIMSGTLEAKKYASQARKDRLSEMVFSSPDGEHQKAEDSCGVSDDKILDAMVQNTSLRRAIEKILHQPKEANVFNNYEYD